jgi:hypothetical protein
MALLTFPRFAVKSTSVAQPLIGSYITAGISGPSNVPLTLTLGDLTAGLGGGSGQYDAQVFIPGSQALLIDPGGTNVEVVTVASLLAGSLNQIILGPKTVGTGNPVTEKSHVSGVFGTGTWILLHTEFNSVYVQPEDGNAGTYLYIGNQYNMTAVYKRAVKLAKVTSGSQPNDWSITENSPGNPFVSSELWVLGGTGNNFDSYITTLTQA